MGAPMRILLDETVLAELVGERQEAAACWSKLVALQLVGAAELWASADAYRVLAEEFAEEVGYEAAAGGLRSTLDFVDVCSVDEKDVSRALSGKGYAQALLVSCARKLRASCIVTRRDPALFGTSFPVYSPEGLFAHLEQERKLSFELVDF